MGFGDNQWIHHRVSNKDLDKLSMEIEEYQGNVLNVQWYVKPQQNQ